jgi:pyruvate dehydrogenase E1 component alpha subunit
MREGGYLDDDGYASLEADVVAEVDDAYAFAEESPDPEPDALFADVYAPEAGGA